MAVKTQLERVVEDMSVNGMRDHIPVLQHVGAVHDRPVDAYPPALDGVLVVLL